MPLHLRPEEFIRNLNQQPRTITSNLIATHRTTMQQIPQNLNPARNNLVRPPSINIGKKANTTGIMLKGGVIQPLRKWTLLKVL
jgi:hypothetical protein